MIKQIVEFYRDGDRGAAIIAVFMMVPDPRAHLQAIKDLIDDGATIQTVDADTIRAVYKGSNQDKLLSLIDDGWGFGGREVEEPQATVLEDEYSPLLEKLSEEEIEEAAKDATDHFFNQRLPGLEGKYAVVDLSLVQGEATEDEMRADVLRFGIDPAAYPEHWKQLLMDQLEEIFDEELFDALQRAVAQKVTGQ
jgi:hypothetical protein